ncbi:unnamed protein product, partial [Arabidopsis halleri]
MMEFVRNNEAELIESTWMLRRSARQFSYMAMFYTARKIQQTVSLHLQPKNQEL